MGRSIKPVEITNSALWGQEGISPILVTLFSFYTKRRRMGIGKILSDPECEILSLLSYRTSFFIFILFILLYSCNLSGLCSCCSVHFTF